MPARTLASNALRKFHSFRPEKSEFSIRRASHLPVEGIGINGTFFINGWVVGRGSNLFVSASGYTPPMELAANSGAFSFYARVTLLRNGEPLMKKSLERGSNEIWADDKYSPIGSAFFMVPPSQDPLAYSIQIEASYIYSSVEGSAVPMPQFARTTIQLVGAEG